MNNLEVLKSLYVSFTFPFRALSVKAWPILIMGIIFRMSLDFFPPFLIGYYAFSHWWALIWIGIRKTSFVVSVAIKQNAPIACMILMFWFYLWAIIMWQIGNNLRHQL